MNLVAWLQEHRRSLLFLLFVLAAGGVASVGRLPVGLFPHVSFPRIVVNVDAGDRPADRMVIEVTRPLEGAVRSVPAVRSIRSNTSRGSADISVNFAWGTDMIAATLQVESAIVQILPTLPPGVSYKVRRMDPTVFPVIGLSITSRTRSSVALRDLALYDLQPLLSTVTGVARIAVLGGDTEEYQVLLDPARLAAVGLTVDDLVKTVSAANVVQAVGRLQENEKLFLILSDTQFRTLAELGRVVVRRSPEGVVLLSDVADIRDSVEPRWNRVVADGQDAVVVNIYQQPDSNTVQIASDLKTRLAEFRARAGSDLDIRTWYDQADLILASAKSVRDSILIGIGLAVLVLFLFLRNVRVTLVAALTVPVVLAITLLILQALGKSLNIMTLGGMAAAVGLIIDDAIVMVEHGIRRLREQPEEHATMLLRAGREMASPLTGSSLVTIVIFAPLAYLSGVTGAFFRALSLTMAIALIVSYVVAFLGVPIFAHLLLRRRDAEGEDVRPWLARVLAGYEWLLRRILGRPLWGLAGVIPLLILGWLAYRHVGTGFMPAMDEGGFVLDYRAPAGTSLAETDRRLRLVESILAQTPEVTSYSRRTGLQLGGGITEANEGDYFIRLRPQPRAPIEEVMNSVRQRVDSEVPGLEIEFAQLMEDLIGDLTAVPQPIEVKLFGPDAGVLREQAVRVAAAIDPLPGVVDVKSGVVLAGDAVRIRVDRLKAEMLGLDPETVTRLGLIALEGDVTTTVQRGEKTVGIRVWTAPDVRSRFDRIRDLRLFTPGGTLVRLGQVATLETEVGQPQLTREDLKSMVAVTGRIFGRDLGSVMRDVRRAVSGVALPAGVYVEYGGLYREQQSSFRGLLTVLVAAALLVFLVLLYQYESFAAPVAILVMDLFAATAVFSGLWWTGTELNISSLMGLTMILGISSEAAVFFMTQWKDSLGRVPFAEALVEAGRLRFRPIVMTALAAILALLPLALGIGQGASMLQPLAIAIIAGLVLTLPAVLLLLPVLFSLLRRERHGTDAAAQ
ncbi:MAG: efflux RND transporter permease subunit [Acidobacteria bacterium]|nr:MAG: efflux RND transporter permease subunit [Acidobacteriota bacterium]